MFPKIGGNPQNGRFIMENPIKMDDFWGGLPPLFLVQHPNHIKSECGIPGSKLQKVTQLASALSSLLRPSALCHAWSWPIVYSLALEGCRFFAERGWWWWWWWWSYMMKLHDGYQSWWIVLMMAVAMMTNSMDYEWCYLATSGWSAYKNWQPNSQTSPRAKCKVA